MNFLEIQNELLNEKWIIISKGHLVKNTTWKKLDISKYGNFSSEEFWWRVFNPDKVPNCVFCGKPINFENYYQTHKKELFCSKKEAYSYAFENRKQTNLKLYGVEFLLQNSEKLTKCKESWNSKSKEELDNINEKREKTIITKYGSLKNFELQNHNKSKQTSMEKYGHEFAVASKEVREKIENTFLIKYNVKNPFAAEKIKDKIKETNLEKYGVSCTFSSDICRKKAQETLKKDLEKFEQENNCTLTTKLNYGAGWYLAKIVPIIKYKSFVFVNNFDIPKIEEYYNLNFNSGTSHAEKELKDFVLSLCDNVEFNTRKIISPKELDIYIPDKKLAIEFNGIFLHSTRPKNYHLEKTKACEKLGIRLIHVFENEWQTQQDIIKSIIINALGQSEKIFARKCEIQSIDSATYKNFLIENHIQGAINSSIRLGLFYKKELVQVVGFGKSRFKKDEYELHRMASKLNTQVIGGFSKLLKNINFEFISYIDKSKFTGNSYYNIGFQKLYDTPPSYSYYKKDNLRKYNRMTFQKNNLKNFANYSSEKSEFQIMSEAGYLRVFDCGTTKVFYGNKNKVD